ncbi:hypothetical protein SPRG_07859 [Saprolegnia parasitica CBS 223.65]|uniref:Uncharacterized protein n=1 Tax=Saprolegnia parasitica (strain CBS 223.65) TaxID=695850 RepID=A0A067CK33_SAPPC|nr:hypothetical protein SPRG_07859 [Saprolegnia parasitica CBS 223.65]KDO27152.1 hypothetical protein SPRG_07859 [Saprolegnia parasitica CBS 223.65]|eukprot:XP_012202240.1 hypothetical protein SPRG_07859 [Saprolegnia parasitica CBS 223.65]
MRTSSVLGATTSLLYVLTSLACCVYYTSLLQPSFANDLWWAGYNVSGYQAFLIDLCNQFLMTNANGSLDVLSASAIVPKTYSTIDAFTSIYTPYMHDVLLGELTSIEYAVPHLRTLSTYWSMRMNVQHCWVDFNKTFEMAHTLLRQERCERRYRANAAVYLEAILRNQPWDAYLALWAGNGLRFNVAIQRGLQETMGGRSFLAQMATAANTTSVADELAYWRSYNLSIFELQWQSRWQPGVSETIKVSNALGIQQSFTLKALDQVMGPWSSQNMFWMPLNDLFNGMTMNRSFVRGTSRHFATNISASLPAINLETYRGMADSRGNLVGKAWVFHTFLGPYLSSDIRYKLRPAPLVTAYNRFQEVVFTHLATSTARFESFSSLPVVVLTPTPSRWQANYTFYGGDPMCILGMGTSYVQQSFDFYDDCSQKIPLSVQLPPMSLLFALLAASTTSRTFSIHAICALSTTPDPCVSMLSVASSWLQELPIPDQILLMLESLPPVLQATDTSFMQFAKASNGSWVLLQQPLLSARDDPWTFYGWCFAADWATGIRQAASFEGDVSSIVLLSNAYTSQHYVTSGQPLETATRMVYYSVVASSVCLVSVGGLALLYTLYSRFHITGRNLLCFNRLVGSVWAGRQLMLMRGTSAILILSTAQPKLVAQFGHSRLVASARSVWETGIVAGEATWVSYCLQEYLVIALPTALTRLYGPWTNALTWLTIVVLDISSPVQTTIELNRACVGGDMDYGLLCTAGAISIGSLSRLLLLFGLQVGLVLILIMLIYGYQHASCCMSFGGECEANDKYDDASLLMSGMSRALVVPEEATKHLYDAVTCVLCGLLPLRLRGRRRIFDLKLWSFLPDTISTTRHHTVSPEHCMVVPARPIQMPPPPTLDLIKTAVDSRRRWSVASALLGLFYMVCVIASSVSYFEISKVNLANDLYWPHFNVTGAHAFFANWLNEQLILRASIQNIALDDPSINLLGSFAAPTAYVSTVHNYGTWLQHSELSSIEASIAGLRVSDACNAPWIFSPYCYLDWKKTWPMAYSHQRQMRCQKMETNAAVYLESVLRNIDWATFEFCWGNAFETAFGSDLRQSSEGVEWLHAVSSERLLLQDEATKWRQHNLSVFQVQWQNYKRIGVFNSYSIVNAFGISYPMQLMALNGSYRWSSQTTYKMYWSLANDLSAIVSNTSGIGGLSLMRTSPRFAFTNTSLQAVLTTNLTLMSPLATALALVAESIGPFGVTDMVYIRVPVAVSSLVRDILHMARLSMGQSILAQAAFNKITPLSTSYPTPKKWVTPKYGSFGGSPLCQELISSKAVSNGFACMPSYDLPCLPTLPAQSKVLPTRQHYIVSAILSGLSASPPSDYRSLCSFDPSNLALCLVYLNHTMHFIRTYMPTANASLTSIAASTNALVHNLNIEFMIFAKVNASAPLALLHTNLLDPSEVGFGFLAWTYLYDWVLGHREVISFQGDSGTLNLLTDLQLPLLQQAQPWMLTQAFATYCRGGVWYVTFLMLSVSALACVYVLASRGHFEGLNMLELSRVGGIVWVGRPLLFLRSLTALCLLSTATLELQTSGYRSYFAAVPTPWYTIALAAGEVTWLVSVVNDIALVFTKEYSMYYTTANSLLVWLIVASLAGAIPVDATLALSPHCQFVQFDFLIACDAGELVIGHLSRLLALIGIVIACNIVCYSAVRRCMHRPKGCVTSLLLSNGAKYLFLHDGRLRGDVYYLDRASAAVAGIVTLRLGRVFYALDIKLWRLVPVALPLTKLESPLLDAALPLLNSPL